MATKSKAMYLIRGTDTKGTLLDSRHRYTMTFGKDAAARKSFAWRILIADDVRQGLFHAAEIAERPHKRWHGLT